MREETTLDELRAERKARAGDRRELEALRVTVERMNTRRHYIIHDTGKTNTIRFGLISDLHCGSTYERFDALGEFLELMKREKIGYVLCAGDVLDGINMYKGQPYEQYAIGFDRQLDALARKVPAITGVDVHFITGNHDYSFFKEAGAGPGERIAQATGWKYAGRDQAWIELRNGSGKSLSVMLSHPDGGTAYALSYRPQKIVESIPGGKKPDILAIGHYHKAEWIPEYRNVSVFQCGCFQSQTLFMLRKGAPAHLGGWIVEAMPGDRKHLTSRVRGEFVAFYEPEEREKR